MLLFNVALRFVKVCKQRSSYMNEIAQSLAQKFNIAPETAQQIVEFVAQQVKGKLPEGLSSQIDGLLTAGTGTAEAAGTEGLLDSVKNLASNLMGKA
jgi:hypothetical protein